MAKTYEQDGRLYFWCPGCDSMMCVCPKRWSWNGNADKPTLSPSILQTCGPYGPLSSRPGATDICHCFVRDGIIEFCGDSTHQFAGKTMPLPDLESVIDLVVIDGRITWTKKSE